MVENLRIAIMGGTFDPIHYGHLVTAQTAKHEFNIDEVLFIPTGIQPFKQQSEITNAEHRYLMAVLATAFNPSFKVLRIEIDRQGKTYTIDTINEIANIYQNKEKEIELFFIIGADAALQILDWKDVKTLFKKCTFIVVTRPGYDKQELFEFSIDINKKFEAKFRFLEVPALDISSTNIRKRVAACLPINYLLPKEVESYIAANNLYTALNKEKFSNIQQKVQNMLSCERYIHTMSVCNEAVKLAVKYGENVEKAYLAALLHDIAKELPNKEKACEKFGINLFNGGIISEYPNVVHSFLGEAVAKHEFDITDSEILNAIKYHTTGRPSMTLLEKIIFVADIIEPNRSIFEGLLKIRKAAYKNIDKAVCLSLKYTISYIKQEKKHIYPLGLQAFEYYCEHKL